MIAANFIESALIPKLGVEELNRINVMERPTVLGFSAVAHNLFNSVSRSEVTCITVGAFSRNHSLRVFDVQV